MERRRRVAVAMGNARAGGQPEKQRQIAPGEDPGRKGRSARNAVRRGLRALKPLMLPDEDAVEFAALEAALVAEPAPVAAPPLRSAACPEEAHRPRPNEPERRPDAGPAHRLEYVVPDPPGPGRMLHEPAAPGCRTNPSQAARCTMPQPPGARRSSARARSQRNPRPAELLGKSRGIGRRRAFPMAHITRFAGRDERAVFVIAAARCRPVARTRKSD